MKITVTKTGDQRATIDEIDFKILAALSARPIGMALQEASTLSGVPIDDVEERMKDIGRVLYAVENRKHIFSITSKGLDACKRFADRKVSKTTRGEQLNLF